MASIASSGGPYATMPCPSEMVPGVSQIRSPMIGIIGDWTALPFVMTLRMILQLVGLTELVGF